MDLIIKKIRNNIFLSYTVLFIIIFFCAIGSLFIVFKKTFVWEFDGATQIVPSFLTYFHWWREFLNNIIHGNFSFPMYDLTIGLGNDLFIYNPLNILYLPFIFWPDKHIELLIEILTILKMYLAGISFIFFIRYKTNLKTNILVGSLIYVFSCSCINSFIQFAFCENFILFPLLFYGLEKIKNEKKYVTYIVILTISTIASYYFTYMYAFFVAAYVIIEIIFSSDKKSEFLNSLKILICSIYSCLIGIAINIPTIIYLSKTDRLTVEHNNPIFFSLKMIGNFLLGLFSCYDDRRDGVIGYTAISFICIISLFIFTQKKEYIKEKIYVILIILGLLIPYFSIILNSFVYWQTRWSFAISFVFAYIVTITIDKIKDYKKIIIALIIYFVTILGFLRQINVIYILSAIAFIITIFLFIKKKNIFFIVAINCIFTSIMFFISDGNILTMSDNNTVYQNIYENTLDNYLKSSEYFDRYDRTYCNKSKINYKTDNSYCVSNYGSCEFYYSIYNNDLGMFWEEIGNCDVSVSQEINGINKRSDLEYFFGNKYFLKNHVTKDVIFSPNYRIKVNKKVPYGYHKKTDEIYESDNICNLINLSDNLISKEQYKKLDSFNKQLLLMNGIICDDGKEYQFTNKKELNYQIVGYKGIQLTDNQINVLNEDNFIDIQFDDVKNGELYIQFSNLKYDNGYRSNILLDDEDFDDNVWYSIEIISQSEHLYSGRSNFLYNFGYITDKRNKIRIKFSNKGLITFDDIKIYFEDEETLKNNTKNIIHPDCNIIFKNNILSTNINVDHDTNILFTIPYSTGWKLYIDGEESKLKKADTAFMYSKISKGNHNIKLKYITPYLKESLSVAFLLILFGIIFFIIKKRTD